MSIAAAAAPLWSADAGRYPLRQIDRPLILPKKMWQERLVLNQVYRFEDTFLDQEGESIYGYLPSLPTWSITDNLSWEAVPLPLFKYLLTPNQVDGEGRTVIKDFSLALEAGVTAAAYSSRDGLQVLSGVGLDFKRPWGERFWGVSRLGVGFENWEPAYLTPALGLGIQITGRTYATTTYSSLLVLEDGLDPLHFATQETGINFHSGLSLGFHVTWVGGSGKSHLIPGSTLSFQW